MFAEVLTCKDAIDGLMMAKQYSEDLRVCLIDMVMPVLSGLELLNRASMCAPHFLMIGGCIELNCFVCLFVCFFLRAGAEPSLSHVKFGLMTEFSAQKKNLSHFMVSDEKGKKQGVGWIFFLFLDVC